jgi:hypothetical protein
MVWLGAMARGSERRLTPRCFTRTIDLLPEAELPRATSRATFSFIAIQAPSPRAGTASVMG